MLTVETLTTYIFRFDYLGSLLLSVDDKYVVKAIFTNIHEYLLPIVLYNFTIMAVALGAGYLGKYLVRVFKLDRRFRFFRFTNKWHYILSGECLDFPHIDDSFEEINFKIVDILYQVGAQQYLYIGELLDWYLDEKGDLEMLHLRNPFKKKLGATDSEIERIPTKFLVLPYKHVININVRYLHVEQLPANSVPTIE